LTDGSADRDYLAALFAAALAQSLPSAKPEVGADQQLAAVGSN
jgi:hypothetical protein